jgi:hypothetical protein
MAKILKSSTSNQFFVFVSYLWVRPKAEKIARKSYYLYKIRFHQRELVGL